MPDKDSLAEAPEHDPERLVAEFLGAELVVGEPRRGDVPGTGSVIRVGRWLLTSGDTLAKWACGRRTCAS